MAREIDFSGGHIRFYGEYPALLAGGTVGITGAEPIDQHAGIIMRELLPQRAGAAGEKSARQEKKDDPFLAALWNAIDFF